MSTATVGLRSMGGTFSGNDP